jgi:hypothetical protein
MVKEVKRGQWSADYGGKCGYKKEKAVGRNRSLLHIKNE